MAKYIVFSDSHGKNDRMYDIIRKNQDQIDGLSVSYTHLTLPTIKLV